MTTYDITRFNGQECLIAVDQRGAGQAERRQVAVLVANPREESNGWYSAHMNAALMFDTGLVRLALAAEDTPSLAARAMALKEMKARGEALLAKYCPGAPPHISYPRAGLEVAWVPWGAPFTIVQYEYHEEVRLQADYQWHCIGAAADAISHARR